MSMITQNASQIFPIHAVPSIKDHLALNADFEPVEAEPEVEPTLSFEAIMFVLLPPGQKMTSNVPPIGTMNVLLWSS